jgi:hypothetical protein
MRCTPHVHETFLPSDVEPTLAAKNDLLYFEGGLREPESLYVGIGADKCESCYPSTL